MKLAPTDRFLQTRTGSWKEAHGSSDTEMLKDTPGRAFSSSFSLSKHARPSSKGSAQTDVEKAAAATAVPAPAAIPPNSTLAAAAACNRNPESGHQVFGTERAPPDAAYGAPPSVGLRLEEVSADLSSLFRQFDTNGDGKLDVREFQQLMLHMMTAAGASSTAAGASTQMPMLASLSAPQAPPPPPPAPAAAASAPAVCEVPFPPDLSLTALGGFSARAADIAATRAASRVPLQTEADGGADPPHGRVGDIQSVGDAAGRLTIGVEATEASVAPRP